MNTRFVTVLLSVFSVVSLGAETSVEEIYGKIRQGDVSVSGSFHMSQNSRDQETLVDTGLGVGYFVADRFALGGTFDLSRDAEGTVSLMGPQVIYYFWQRERLAAQSWVALALGLTDNTVQSRITVGLGLEYFITPSVAFGPYVSMGFLNSRVRDYSRFGTGASFGIYL